MWVCSVGDRGRVATTWKFFTQLRVVVGRSLVKRPDLFSDPLELVHLSRPVDLDPLALLTT